MNEKLNIKVTNKKSDIVLAQAKVKDFCDRNGLGLRLKQELSLILDELITNTISYAFDDEEEHLITFKIFLNSEKLNIIYIDDGIPFDPTSHKTSSPLLKSVSEKPLGSLGIHLVKNLTDEMIYTRKNGKNILELTKTIN